MSIDLFDARALAPLVRFLESNGYQAEPLLDLVRIPVQLVDSGGWVSKKQAYDFTWQVVRRTGCVQAVYSAYVDFQMSYLGPIADAVRSCKTVKEALDVAIQLGSIAYEGSEFRLNMEGDTTWFSYREPKIISEGQPFVADLTLMVYYHLIRTTVDEPWRPRQMRTQGGVNDRHRSLEIFHDCPAEFHPGHSALAFPTEFLSRRLPWQSNPPRMDLTQSWQFAPEGSEPIVDKLYRLIASRFRYRKLPTLEQLASMVNSSPATLKRQLALAGTTYGKLLDRVRYDAACEMLSIPQFTIHEIARELGYSGTNNFVRSFRRMTGVTPGQFRRFSI